MVDVNITVDLTGLRVLEKFTPAEVGTRVEGLVHEGALFGTRTVVGFTPVDTGALKGSITPQMVSPREWRVVSPLYYAPLVEDDTRPHVITPKHGKFLRFVAGGRVVFTKLVRHPGTKGHHMFARAVPVIVQHLDVQARRVFS